MTLSRLCDFWDTFHRFLWNLNNQANIVKCPAYRRCPNNVSFLPSFLLTLWICTFKEKYFVLFKNMTVTVQKQSLEHTVNLLSVTFLSQSFTHLCPEECLCFLFSFVFSWLLLLTCLRRRARLVNWSAAELHLAHLIFERSGHSHYHLLFPSK